MIDIVLRAVWMRISDPSASKIKTIRQEQNSRCVDTFYLKKIIIFIKITGEKIKKKRRTSFSVY